MSSRRTSQSHLSGVMSRSGGYLSHRSPQSRPPAFDSDSDVPVVAMACGCLGGDNDLDPDVYIDDAAGGNESDSKSQSFRDCEHMESSLRGFQSLRESQQLFDVTLSVDGKQFNCHRALLASSSEYFRCLFTTKLSEQNQSVISISGVDARSMKLVLDYIYTGCVELNSDTVQNLLSSANLFQLAGLRDGCADYMEQKIEIDNCIGIHFFAQVCCTLSHSRVCLSILLDAS